MPRRGTSRAVKSFYSTSWMLHGHTGGGIGEIWRSAAMGLMDDKKPLKYREFMDNRQWFYELSRRFDGSMGIVGATIGTEGDTTIPTSWGIGLALDLHHPAQDAAHHRRAGDEVLQAVSTAETAVGHGSGRGVLLDRLRRRTRTARSRTGTARNWPPTPRGRSCGG